MEQRPLGATGLDVSVLGFGAGNVGGLMIRGTRQQQLAGVERALDAGITYFDTARAYGDGLSETNLGSVLHELGATDSVIIGTKIFLGVDDLRDPAAAVLRSVTASLAKLRRDRVDLLQLHNPLTSGSSQHGRHLGVSDVAAAADAIQMVVKEGLASHAGFTGVGDVDAVMAATRGGSFAAMQSYFNVINPSAGFAGASGGADDMGGIIDVAAGSGLGVIAIRVMAGGAITGTLERAPLASSSLGRALVPGNTMAFDVDSAARRDVLARWLGLESALELTLRFVISHPGVSTALVGFSDIDQLDSAIRWTERGPLSEDQRRKALDAAAGDGFPGRPDSSELA